MHDIMKVNQQRFPFGLNSAVDMADWVQRAGFEFTFSNHPGLPSTKLSFENKQMSHAMPDSELDESLRKQMIMSFGLTPETVDSGLADAEFATTIVHNNILLSKRVTPVQNHFTPIITSDVRKTIRADNCLRKELTDIIANNISSIEKHITEEQKELIHSNRPAFINYMLELFIDNINIELPKPDGTTLETLKATILTSECLVISSIKLDQ